VKAATISKDCVSSLAGDYRDRLYVAPSRIDGQGLFSCVAIPDGTPILRLEGQRIQHPYGPEFAATGPNWIGIDYGVWLIPDKQDKVMHLNHACDPNVLISAELDVVAIKTIPADGELCLDYSTTELCPYWAMDCNCGSSDCRRRVRGFQYLPRLLQDKYRPYIASVFWDLARVREVSRC
jgi:hypothetical protein